LLSNYGWRQPRHACLAPPKSLRSSRTSAGGSKYEGSWKDGSFRGLGVFTWDDGSRYEGSFVNDQFHGKGAKFNPDGSLDFEGMWWNDDFLSDLGTPVH